MKCNLAGMNGCHDPGNDCVIIIFIIFIFSRLVAEAYFYGLYFLFFTYVVVNGREPLFCCHYFYYYFDVGSLVKF